MGRGKKRKRELHMLRPFAPWDAESEKNWWSVTDGYEEQWLSYDNHELDRKRIQELEDLLHAEKSQKESARLSCPVRESSATHFRYRGQRVYTPAPA